MPPDSQEKMKMRSRDCTEHRHTKIIHFSPWCEVSIVPPAPHRLKPICHPSPSYEVSSWTCRKTCGAVDVQEGWFNTNRRQKQNPRPLYKLAMKSFEQFRVSARKVVDPSHHLTLLMLHHQSAIAETFWPFCWAITKQPCFRVQM